MAENEPLNQPGGPKQFSGEVLPVRRGKVESVDLYEIKDTELEFFERGAPEEPGLSFAIFLLTLAVSAVVTVTTVPIANVVVKFTYIVVTVVGFIFGSYLTMCAILAARRSRPSLKMTCLRIRERIRPNSLTADSSPDERPKS